MLLKRGMTWSDVRSISLDQAIYLLFGDRTEADQVQEKRIDAQVRMLLRVAKAAGRTGPELARMGPVAIVALIKEQTGQDITPDRIEPLLEEPEFL